MADRPSGWRGWFRRARDKKKSPISNLRQDVRDLAREMARVKTLSAQSLIRDHDRRPEPMPLAKTEFQVYSQFGDDGIIQYILGKLNLPATEQRFVEFGVENYTEANTRFLLLNNNWSGLVLDGSEENIASIRRDDIYWRHDLIALARFITRENIDGLLAEAGFGGRLGLLSIDIDGNDYWVWEAITAVEPAVVIVEYNGLFGAHAPVTIPYQSDFTRAAAHHSHLYWGTSLAALCHLALRKNYVWIGCNSAGNNAYFVRKAESTRFLCPRLPDGFVAAKYREARDPEGRLSFLGQRDGFALVEHLPVWNVAENRLHPLAEIVQ